MSEPATTTDTHPGLDSGDALARAGQWSQAIEAWRIAVEREPSSTGPVQRRLSWFLSQSGFPVSRRKRTLPLVAAATVAAILATVFVLIPDQPGTRAADLWAVAAWIMIAIATVSVLIAARRSGSESLDLLIRRARAAARLVDNEGNGTQT